MDGYIRREALAVACVEQLTELVGVGNDIAGLIDRHPAAPIQLDEFALHESNAIGCPTSHRVK